MKRYTLRSLRFERFRDSTVLYRLTPMDHFCMKLGYVVLYSCITALVIMLYLKYDQYRDEKEKKHERQERLEWILIPPQKKAPEEVSTRGDILHNVCALPKEWRDSAKKMGRKRGVDPSLILTIMQLESGFRSHIRPVDHRGHQRSTAVGFAQALDQTWNDFKQDTGQYSASRHSFSDSAYFIVWYAYKSHRKLGIGLHDIENHYLAYHDGWTGFTNQTYASKPWLTQKALEAKGIYQRIKGQLTQC